MGRNIVSGAHVGFWVAQRIGGVFTPANSVAIGLEKDGTLIAGIMYEHWNGRSIVAHIAIEGRMTPAFVGAIFDYAYNVCGAEKAIVPVGSHNVKSQKLVEHMGFSEEGRLKDAQPDGDIILYTLKKSDCRFLGEKYGQKCSHAASTT